MTLKSLTNEEVEKFSQRKNAKAIAVSNFLSTMGGQTYEDACGNLEMDAHMYKWNSATVAAIRAGILLASSKTE